MTGPLHTTPSNGYYHLSDIAAKGATTGIARVSALVMLALLPFLFVFRAVTAIRPNREMRPDGRR
jgi:hypothetical protein